MFTACFDASGDDHSQILLVVAGFVAEANAWEDWEAEWLERLRQDDLELFHKADLMDRRKKRRLVEDLSAITRAHVAYKFGVIVENEALTDTLSKKVRDEWHIKAYSIAGRTVAKEARLWAQSWGGPIPELVYEKGDKGAGNLRTLLVTEGYPAPIFRPKRQHRDRKSGHVQEAFVPLQAADLLAGEIFAVGRAVLRKDELQRELKWINPDLDKIAGEFGFIEKDRFRLIVQGHEEQDALVMVPQVKIRTRE